MTDIKKLDLKLLVVFDALLDERNVTRAAIRLGYTPANDQRDVGPLARRVR
jgi:DNA-binding transcriptional LysR family regulator